jgi:hypothetical protein
LNTNEAQFHKEDNTTQTKKKPLRHKTVIKKTKVPVTEKISLIFRSQHPMITIILNPL